MGPRSPTCLSLRLPFDDSRFETLKSSRGAFMEDAASGLKVFHVEDQHSFVQAAGYLKYLAGQEDRSGVFFRGQTELYPSMVPTLYRGLEKQGSKEGRDGAMKEYMGRVESDGRVLRHVHPRVREPLLQHYGIRTRWLDVVDNAWVALWFGCFSAVTTGRFKEFLHYERRGGRIGESVADQYAYVVLLAGGFSPCEDSAGVYFGEETELVDLRVAAPSHFIRPHAQHGLLLRRRVINHAVSTASDYIDFVVGAIRVSLPKALQWLGDGGLTRVHALFPPPSYDFGYLELLRGAPAGSPVLRAIHHVGA